LTAPGGNPLRPEHFAREDEAPDPDFYREARLVTHIDDAAIGAATRFYRDTLPETGAILDLMSSWISHLPRDRAYSRVVGLGMNADELSRNDQLTEWLVQDLNVNPVLPYADDTFDGAVDTVSVQYLTNPVDVFAEVGRVLKPGAPFILTYSNRCFPTKAVAIWRVLSDRDHADLIALYFRLSGAFEQAEAIDLSPNPGSSDPLYAVYGRARARTTTAT
jgi:SAM-dependent methyltransferase